jgi:imidazoleglycerol-phosphate dehydratase/histidinol-phosphatase
MNPERQGHRWRCLRESWLEVDLDLDRSQPITVATDSDALSRAIEHLARGGGFALVLKGEGGPVADSQLVAEDCGYELGAALREALRGSARSRRVGQKFAVAGASAEVELEFAGRPGARVETGFRASSGTTMPAAWMQSFFQAFALGIGVRLEVRSLGGLESDVVAACFRAVGAAIGQVTRASSTAPGS